MEQLIEELRQKLMEADTTQASSLKRQLLGEIARALQEQNLEKLGKFNAALADLATLADHHDEVPAGEQWRSLNFILRGLIKAGFPLKDLLMTRGTLADKLLGHIRQKPGQKPSELAESLEKSPSHISTLLKTLESKGLIHRLGSTNRRPGSRVYLSPAAKDLFDSLSESTANLGSQTETKATPLQIPKTYIQEDRLPEETNQLPMRLVG